MLLGNEPCLAFWYAPYMEDPAPAAPVAPVAPQGPAPAVRATAARGRGHRHGRGGQGRGRGCQWTVQQRMSLRNSKLQSRLCRHTTALSRAAKSVAPGRQKQVTQAFGHDHVHRRGRNTQGSCRNLILGSDGRGNDIQIVHHVKCVGSTEAKLRRRGVVSHIRAVWPSTTKLLWGCDRAINVIYMGDANCWIKKPRDAACPHRQRAEQRMKAKKGVKKGRNVHVPILNIVQHLHTSGAGTTPRACRIPIPSQVLPKSNWATVYNRLSRWAMSGWRSGRLMGQDISDHSLQRALDSVSDCVLMICRDNLITNNCMLEAEKAKFLDLQRRLQHEQPGLIRLLFELTCTEHNICLCTRPAYTRLKGLPGALVRLSHLLESSHTR